jgi:hypothetical protein
MSEQALAKIPVYDISYSLLFFRIGYSNSTKFDDWCNIVLLLAADIDK